MELYLGSMWKCGLYAVVWLHITDNSILIQLLTAPQDLYSTLSVPVGMILLILYLMVLYWQVSRAMSMLFYWPMLLYPFLLSSIFPFRSFAVLIGIAVLGSLDR